MATQVKPRLSAGAIQTPLYEETYNEQKDRHQKEFGEIKGMFFAFSPKQLKEGLQKIGLPPIAESNKLIYSLGAGGYILKENIGDLEALMKKHTKERKELRKDRKKLLEALIYELNNHEYCYTGDPTDALEVLDLTRETVPADILKEAISKCYREE